jgi:DnaJ-class molecular chaperone
MNDDEDFNLERFIDQLEEDDDAFEGLDECEGCEGRGYTDDEELCPLCNGGGPTNFDEDY